MSENSKTALKAAIVATLMAGLFATAAEAAPNSVNNIADILHPDIHTKVGQRSVGGTNANANPSGNANGGQVHGIGANPGQSDNDPSDGAPGFADQLNNTSGQNE
jgi:hypothetical protein